MGLDYLSIGLRIRNKRNKLGISQEALAEKTSLSRTYISHVENGRKSVSLEAVIEICNVLEIPVDELLVDNITFAKPQKGDDITYVLLDCSKEEQAILTKTIVTLRETLRGYKIRK